jgi:HD-GYP domain-containing protein (c-di-GMP phosphodiesterase class II)
MRVAGQLAAINIARMHPAQKGLMALGDQVYQVASAPIDQGEENLGSLSVGEYLDLNDLGTPTVLSYRGRVLKSSIPAIPGNEVESSLGACGDRAECELRLRGETYMSSTLQGIALGEGYILRTLQSVDAASGPVQAILRNVFLVASLGAVLAASLLSAVSSRSIAKPIAAVLSQLRKSEGTGLLPEFQGNLIAIKEIRELTEGFNRAALAIREGRNNLYGAYVEFVGSLANALDARDRYTAGHSRRVSELSCSVGRAMGVADDALEDIRMGALLHDIGKIGIPDSLLQNPGRLTSEEFAAIQQHPTIGRRILEGVHGFRAYLSTVELHHENWDGSGYPLGLRCDATPLGARIVHVSDAYDAMTTDRPYRRGMTHEEAIRTMRVHAGSQFDPRIVDVFITLFGASPREPVDVPARETARLVRS